jgi:hypothetical protein
VVTEKENSMDEVQPQPAPEPAFESAPQPVPEPAFESEPQQVELNDFDEEDVKAALERETQDGPGDLDNLPKEDFVSFAEPDVEVEE